MKSINDFYIRYQKLFELALHDIRTKKYTKKEIIKKNGGTRELNIPPRSAKILQKKLSEELYQYYIPPKPVHGFIKSKNNNSKSIITNAEKHIKKNIVINIDIDSFFDSINFGRARGLFISRPFNIEKNLATKIAQLIVYDNKLPQGAPTSPIISNIICLKMDHNLIKFAKKYSLTYTRYADDMSFSTNKKNINTNKILKEIEKIIKENGFKINRSKTRIQYSYQSQIVTGLKVNNKVNVDRKYIRRIRSMLFSWYKYGLKEATKNHFNEIQVPKRKTNFELFFIILNKICIFFKFNCHFNLKNKKNINEKYTSFNKEESFKNILLGKINFLGQVRGLEDDIFIRFKHTYYLLNDNFNLKIKLNEFEHLDINNLKKKEVLTIFSQIYDSILVFTEGETDITYIKSALKHFQENGEYKSLRLRFCNLKSISNMMKIYKSLYSDEKDISVLNIRKCILPYIKDNLKVCFIPDSDNPKEVIPLKKSKIKNYYLIAEEEKGYIEKLFEKEALIKQILEHGYKIDLTNEKLQVSSKKGLKKYLESDECKDDDIHSISSTSYIGHKDMIITKPVLARLITNDSTINYDKFKSMFEFLNNMSHDKEYVNNLCCKSIY